MSLFGKALFVVLSLITGLSYASSDEAPVYVEARLFGRLGNQLFQAATALNLAFENNAVAIFPDLETGTHDNIPLNRETVLWRLNAGDSSLARRMIYTEDPLGRFETIPFVPNMTISGYFQSERYFYAHRDKIRALFEPKAEILNYLLQTYPQIVQHPCSVACHLRAYTLENSNLKNIFADVGRKYIDRAAKKFPKQALFVIFSDNIAWAKKVMKGFSRKHIFIENEPYYHDFFLMSLCRHQIISNSSFSWWAAYLNTNPHKIVMAPSVWFLPRFGHPNDDIVPSEWIKVKVD